MPQTCSVCKHADRASIERALIAGQSLRSIAGQYSLSDSAVLRHKQAHLPAELAKATDAAEVAQADTLLDRLRQINAETAAILREVRSSEPKDNEMALKAIARIEKQIELEGRLLGELQQPTVNVLIMPEWVGLRTAILRALEPYPEARLRLAEVIDAGR